MATVRDNLPGIRVQIEGLSYAAARPAIDSYDWSGYYPVVEDGIVTGIAEASDTRYEIVSDEYMAPRS